MQEERELIFLDQGRMEFAMSVTKEELALFNKLFREDPDKWDNRELDLLFEVKRILREGSKD